MNRHLRGSQEYLIFRNAKLPEQQPSLEIVFIYHIIDIDIVPRSGFNITRRVEKHGRLCLTACLDWHDAVMLSKIKHQSFHNEYWILKKTPEGKISYAFLA